MRRRTRTPSKYHSAEPKDCHHRANYAIKGSGNSFARRKWELELHQYYSKAYTPLDEFGKLMFGDWNDDDWCEFDNYMIGCLKNYLRTGLVKE